MRYVFILFSFCAFTGRSAVNLSDPDVRSVSLGKIHALSEESVNPAYLSFQPAAVVDVSFCNYYQIKELNTVALGGILPNRYLDCGLHVAGYGFRDYREWTVRGGFSKKITSRIALGTNLAYRQTTMDPIGDMQPVISGDIGLFFRLNKGFDLALLAKNLVDNTTYDPCMLYAGMKYTAVPSCSFLLELFSDCNALYGVSSGIEYELEERFKLRVGLHSRPLTPTFGLAFSFDSFTVDAACEKHQTLGFNTLLGVSYHF